MPDYIQVHTTTDNRDKAAEIARTLVERRLAACAQIIGPITSTYRWQGKIEEAREWLCYFKTRKSLYQEVEKAIKSIHNYTVPEILSFNVEQGNADYLDWLDEAIKK